MRQTTIVLLMMLAAVTFALWFVSTHERVSRDIRIGYQREARLNAHLAAKMVLQELDVAAESRATLTPSDWLPGDADTLFIRLSPSIAIGEERAALLKWVSDGGSLVLLPALHDVSDTAEFLALLGFSLTEIDYRFGGEGDEEEVLEDAVESDDGLATDFEYKMIENSQQYRISIDDDAAAVQVVADGDNLIVVRREWGGGLVTLFASANYFINPSLKYGDHARLLADVVAGEYSPGTVWFIYETTFSSLWEKIWRGAPYLVLGLAMSFFLWLWAVMPAFGPRLTQTQIPRRSIIEHVKAAGIFTWRHDGGNELAESAIQFLLHDAEARHPGLSRLSKQQQADTIARLTGMTAQAVMDVLNGHPERRQGEFTQEIRSVQTIRKKL